MTIYRLLKRPLLLLCGLLLYAGISFAADSEAEIAAIQAQLENNRRMVVEENMNLTADQQEGFWKLYSEYRQEMAALQGENFELLREFRASFDDLTDERAEELLTLYLSIEARTNTVRQNYIERFNAVLAAKQTLRFYQIDVKVDSIIQTEMSSTNPLVPG